MGAWTVQVADESGALGTGVVGDLERAALTVLQSERAGATELSIALLDDGAISSLNEQYLSHAGPTDVISFPLHQAGLPLVGDIYIGVEQAARQAAELGIPLREELLRLVIHGTLHVLGWDHTDGPDRMDAPMYARQEELLHLVNSW
jgi:probable rRNA maturation factor